MKAFEINTTAWEEENFILFTDLTEKQIIDVIEPIKSAYWKLKMETGNYDDDYTNDDLIDALMKAYPNNKIYSHDIDIKLLSI